MSECISKDCSGKTLEDINFCNDCLDGMLVMELHIDDLVPGLENAVESTWERITEEKRRLRK